MKEIVFVTHNKGKIEAAKNRLKREMKVERKLYY